MQARTMHRQVCRIVGLNGPDPSELPLNGNNRLRRGRPVSSGILQTTTLQIQRDP